ncbi:alpha/beta hydrolase [Alkalicoccus luteus]|uniref:Alpha/beta hydrolase n=1 Tax=Alkalicoccus luteus TaxID=1237094 RepID=A0A969TUA7_9BACI|nr:alpha/beta hydrolase-fold protein [Alkalicoccus luteus]NJP36862.1 alpha/beta hydrolase [Alkalicoccus luteus]
MPIDTYEQTVLDKRRQISIYTPASYQRSAKRYPVLYMHDGQNVFDDDRAFYGRSWRAAEAAERADVIIVAVDCNTEGTGRLDDYSVWELQADVKQKLALDPSRSAGDRGKAYIRYLMEELKPEMVRKWRTDPDRIGMAGSSAGGNCT